MKISLTSDFAGSTGEPADSLRALAEAGFTNVMWCHHWCDDFLYGRDELAYIKKLFSDYGLALSDIHGSQGVEKCWHSPVEYRRRAGVELVANRVEMLRELGGDGTIMNTPSAIKGLQAFKQPYEARLAFAKDAYERCARFAAACGAA